MNRIIAEPELVYTGRFQIFTLSVSTEKEEARPRCYFVINFHNRGMVAVTEYRERIKVIDFMQNRVEGLDHISGIPALDYESAYDGMPLIKAANLLSRALKLGDIRLDDKTNQILEQ